MTKLLQPNQSAAFRRLLEHLRDRTDVQNIDMMNLAGFLSQLYAWYREAANDVGIEMDEKSARALVSRYGIY